MYHTSVAKVSEGGTKVEFLQASDENIVTNATVAKVCHEGVTRAALHTVTVESKLLNSGLIIRDACVRCVCDV